MLGSDVFPTEIISPFLGDELVSFWGCVLVHHFKPAERKSIHFLYVAWTFEKIYLYKSHTLLLYLFSPNRAPKNVLPSLKLTARP